MHNSIINATHAVKGPIRSVNIHLHTLWENSRDPVLLYKDIIHIIDIRLNELYITKSILVLILFRTL